MAEYTPTTEEIRARATRSTTYPQFASPTLREDFDRWLDAHDAEVRARAFREAAGVARNYETGYDTTAATISEALTDAAEWREVRAGVVAEELEGQRQFSAAYRARNGHVVSIGMPTAVRADAEAVVKTFRREDDEGPDYFVANRILPPWVPVQQEGEPS